MAVPVLEAMHVNQTRLMCSKWCLPGALATSWEIAEDHQNEAETAVEKDT